MYLHVLSLLVLLIYIWVITIICLFYLLVTVQQVLHVSVCIMEYVVDVWIRVAKVHGQTLMTL